ncbi:MAG TPA: hypothetical protein VFD76_03390 [Gemmatimonadales bacterium]|jgi:hypothetical protein|nr:hypothetical protein [Gemmatimonadales bacterium]
MRGFALSRWRFLSAAVALPAAACGGATSPIPGPASHTPAKLTFTVPPAAAIAGAAISPAVTVAVQDSQENTVTTDSTRITVAIGTNPRSGTLSGTLTQSAVNGVATFGNLSLDRAGTGYTLTAAATGLTGANSTPFNVTAASASTFIFTVQPSTATAGAAITPAIQVSAQDVFGNTATGFTGTVTLAIGTNPAAGTLSGTTSVVAVGGVADFALSIDKQGTGYVLTATAPGLNGASSTVFNSTAFNITAFDVTTCAIGIILDQEQLVYDGGASARTLPGYSVWQSFTPGVSGTLTEIDMGFFNDMSGSGQLQVLSGDGSAGPVLQTLTVPVRGITQSPVTWNAWAVSVSVTAGLRYTFRFTPNAATLPDPYGVALGSSNPYPGGVMGTDDPSGSYRTDFDAVFRTCLSR